MIHGINSSCDHQDSHSLEMDHRVGIYVVLLLCIAYQLWQVEVDAQCTAAGRFANTSDTTCQTYIYCVYVSANTSYLSYNYTCPTTSVFNPASSQCTAATNYTCTNTGTTTTTNDCTAEGFFADPNVSDCSSYIQCVDLNNGTYFESTLTCPTNTYYDPSTTLCDSNYACSFTCTTAGRFADTTDNTCQSYYYCVLTATGTFVQYNYTCPTTSVFNPNTSVCTTNYTCMNSG